MFADLTITEVRPEGRDAVAITFAGAEGFGWQPGQYLTLRATVAGADLRRSYSIAALPEGAMCVGVKRVDGGAFSTFAQGLKPGDVVQAMPPEGRFVLHGERDVLLIAAGSGITPMVSIAAAVLAQGGRVTLVYGNRDTGSIMFREALDALKDRYLDRFTLVHVLSREAQDVALLNGRVTGERVLALARAGAVDLSADGIFLCGPGGMIDDVSAALQGAGVTRDRLYFERFYTEDAPRAAPSAQAEAAARHGVAVSVVLDGVTRQFDLTEAGDSIVDAAARAGLELPWSCKGGMCCTCRAKLTQGDVEMEHNYSLEEWEMKAGFVLTCQARPTTKSVAVDFDQL